MVFHRTDSVCPIDAGFISLSLENDSGPKRRAESVIAEQKQLVIVGDAGAGKTTLMQWEAVHCHTDDKAISMPCNHGNHEDVKERKKISRDLIPFFIRLRRLIKEDSSCTAFPSPKKWVNLSTEDLLLTEPDGWMNTLLRDNRALLILDGLDELPPEKRSVFWRKLQKFLRYHPDLCFRVTFRPFPRTKATANQWSLPKHPKTQ